MNQSGKTRSVFRFFFAWQDDQEEKWLEKMARQGWHLVRGGIVFRFVEGKPGEFRYRLDYRPGSNRSLEEYFTLFADSGWEHVCSFGGWHCFRTGDASAPEVFTDVDSKVEKYRRLLMLLLVFLMASLVILSRSPRSSSSVLYEFYAWAKVVQSCVVVLLGYAAVRVYLHIRRLRRKAAELTRRSVEGKC